MGKIKFESIESDVRFLNPMKEFAADAQTLKIRKDPLLGDTSVLIRNSRIKPRFFSAAAIRN